MSNEKASIVCFKQFIEAFLTKSSKSPAGLRKVISSECGFPESGLL